MNEIKVSVILPVYNVEKYLRQCLDSICNQSLQDIEIICVDDGSTDSSATILKEYSAKDSRIQIITQINGGAGKARNTGLKVATGKYLSFLDSDDFFEANMLEDAWQEAEKYQADFVVFNSDQYHMDKQAFDTTVHWNLRMRDIPPYMPFTYRELTDNIFKTFVGWAWDKLYRRGFIIEHDLWFQEQRTSNDLLFVFSALVLAKKIVVLDKILAHQRRGTGESLSVTREKSWYCFYDALIALRTRLQRENIYWEVEQDYINYALHFSLWNANTLVGPTKQLLINKLCTEWFTNLGITGKTADFFWIKQEYENYCKILLQNEVNISVVE